MKCCTTGTFTGGTLFSPLPEGGLLHRETGVFTWHGVARPAERTLRFLPGPEPGTADVRFADGRPFHGLDLTSGRHVADHPCVADLYRGEFTVGGADRWRRRFHRQRLGQLVELGERALGRAVIVREAEVAAQLQATGVERMDLVPGTAALVEGAHPGIAATHEIVAALVEQAHPVQVVLRGVVAVQAVQLQLVAGEQAQAAVGHGLHHVGQQRRGAVALQVLAHRGDAAADADVTAAGGILRAPHR